MLVVALVERGDTATAVPGGHRVVKASIQQPRVDRDGAVRVAECEVVI